MSSEMVEFEEEEEYEKEEEEDEEEDEEEGEGEDEDEDEEDEEGPPPGFHCITSSRTQQEAAAMEADNNVDEDNEEEVDEGPPPGWSSIPPSVQQPIHTSDVDMLGNEEDDDEDEDDDGPPPGWHLPQSTSQTAEAAPESNQENSKDQEEGPPPGWESLSSHKQTPPSIKALPPPLIPDTEVGRKKEDKHRDLGAQAGVQSAVAPPCTPLLPTPRSLPSASALPSDKSFTDKGQLVCGSCRKLLSYPIGAKYVKCSCCQTVNLVLEAHQIGQVKCGSCAVLLMYSNGAPAVRCSSCRHVTEIGAHNKRPPLSVQQERRLPSSNRVH